MWIVSRDRIFARAMQIALSAAGLPRPRLTASLPESTHTPLIVDLDDFSPPDQRRTITFSSSPERAADLTRPFLMSDLVKLARTRFALEISAPAPVSDLPTLLLTEGGVLLNGQTVLLSPGERSLLRLLLSHAGECVPKEEIDRLWKSDGNMTEVYIRHLRKKLDEPAGLRLIRTVRGKGYILCLPNTSL